MRENSLSDRNMESLQEIVSTNTLDLETCSLEEMWSQLRATSGGLTTDEAGERLRTFGPNNSTSKKEEENAFARFVEVMSDPAYSLLLGAFFVSTVFVMMAEGFAVFVMLGVFLLALFNFTISLIFEKSTRKSICSSISNLAPTAKVQCRRDNTWKEIDIEGLVPGDVIMLTPGDVIPADCRLLSAQEVQVNQATQGVSASPVSKRVGDTVDAAWEVTEGESEAVVISTTTGRSQSSAPSQDPVPSEHSPSPPPRAKKEPGPFYEACKVVRSVCLGCTLLAALTELIVMVAFQGRTAYVWAYNLLALLIAGGPVAMRNVLAIALWAGTQALSTQGAIPKRSKVFEPLAAMDVLLYNDDDALSSNGLNVDKSMIETYGTDVDQDKVVLLAARASSQPPMDQDRVDPANPAHPKHPLHTIHSLLHPVDPVNTVAIEPVDAAILGCLVDPEDARAGIEELEFLTVGESGGRYTCITYQTHDGQKLRAMKGDPFELLRGASNKEAIEKRALATIDDFAHRGKKCLGVARQYVTPYNEDNNRPCPPWTMVGLIPLLHPSVDDSSKLIEETRNLGVRVKIISRDHVGIAREACKRLGMGTQVYASSLLLRDVRHPVTVGRDVQELIEEASGFGEVSPEDRCELITRLQHKGHVCGVTGKYYDDVAALRKADVGFAVACAGAIHSGAVIRASDVVLTKPGFDVTVKAVGVSRNISRVLKNYSISAISSSIHLVLSFLLLATIWEFDLSPFMILIVVLLNNIISNVLCDDVHEPCESSAPRDGWEIMRMGVVLGAYLSAATVLFFWVSYYTDFFPSRFGTSPDLSSDREMYGTEMMSVLFFHLCVSSSTLLFACRSEGFSLFDEKSQLLVLPLLMLLFVVMCLAMVLNEPLLDVGGCSPLWIGIVLLYSVVTYIPLEILKIYTSPLVSRVRVLISQNLSLSDDQGPLGHVGSESSSKARGARSEVLYV